MNQILHLILSIQAARREGFDGFASALEYLLRQEPTPSARATASLAARGMRP